MREFARRRILETLPTTPSCSTSAAGPCRSRAPTGCSTSARTRRAATGATTATIVEQDLDGLKFLFKHHVVHAPQNRFPKGFRDMLDEDQLVLSFWWEDSFGAREVIFDRAEDLDAYLGDFVAENGGADVTPERRRRGLRARR